MENRASMSTRTTVDLRLTRRKDGWWITGIPGGPEHGPYIQRAEAEDARRGLERFYKANPPQDENEVD
jgi:hypothetical protein